MKDDKQNDRQGVALSEREAFEAAMTAQFGEGEDFTRDAEGCYTNRSWHDAWIGWQASRASSSRAEVEREGARDQLAALVDIYDDAMNNPPEARTYVDGAFGQQMTEARAWLAAAEAPNGETGNA